MRARIGMVEVVLVVRVSLDLCVPPIGKSLCPGPTNEQQSAELFLGPCLCLPDSCCVLTHTLTLTRKST